MLTEQLRLCRTLYNAALQERRDAHRKAGKTITAYDQMKYLSEIKEALPEYKGVYSQVQGGGLVRLHPLSAIRIQRVRGRGVLLQNRQHPVASESPAGGQD